MRVLLLALMIALLPLRGWMGDAMAVEHPAEQAVAVAMDHDCHDNMDGADQELAHHAAHGVHHADGTGDDTDCSSCQVCHSVVLAAVVLPLGGEALPLAAPRTLPHLHTSAEPSPEHRPPIV